MPGRSSGRMRQRNEIEAMTGEFPCELMTNDLIQPSCGHKLRNRQLADWDNQLRMEEPHLALKPVGTIPDFFIGRDAITAFGSFSRKTATNRSHVNRRSELCFGDACALLEPA